MRECDSVACDCVTAHSDANIVTILYIVTNSVYVNKIIISMYLVVYLLLVTCLVPKTYLVLIRSRLRWYFQLHHNVTENKLLRYKGLWGISFEFYSV